MKIFRLSVLKAGKACWISGCGAMNMLVVLCSASFSVNAWSQNLGYEQEVYNLTKRGPAALLCDPYRKSLTARHAADDVNSESICPVSSGLFQVHNPDGELAVTLSDPVHQNIVGRGFYSYDKVPSFQSALNPDTYQVYVSKASSELGYSLSFNTHSLVSQIGYGGSFDAPIEGVQFKAENDFLARFENNSKTISLVYSFQYKYLYQITQRTAGAIMMEESALARYKEDPLSFIGDYGDRFIDKSDAGGAVFLMIKVFFTSEKDRAEFERRISVEAPDIASISAYIKGSMTYDSENGRVRLHALQIGGKPLELSRLLGSKEEDYNFASVDMLDEKLKAVAGYPREFARQINPDDASTYVVLGKPSTMSYTTLGNIPQGTQLPDQPFSKDVANARKVIQQGFREYTSLKNRDIAVARRVQERASHLFYSADKDRLKKLIQVYDNVTHFYTEADNTPQQYCYVPGDEKKNCLTAADYLNRLPEDIGFTSFVEMNQTAADFGFTINIDDTLFAYPISSRSTVKALKPRLKKPEALKSDDTSAAQRFALFNADGFHVADATLIADAEDLKTVQTVLAPVWGMDLLATRRFEQLAHNGGYVSLFWLTDDDSQKLGAVPLHPMSSAEGVMHGFLSLDNQPFPGVNYGNTVYRFGGKHSEEKRVGELFLARQTFRFDHSDVLNNGLPVSRYCYKNPASTAFIDNERTGKSSGAAHYGSACVDARPGDVITWRVYWLFSDYAVTRQWTVSSPDNTETHDVLYTTEGVGAVPAGAELPEDIGRNVTIVKP